MGLADFFSDIVSSLGIPEAQAEAPPQDVETSSAESAEKADESTEDTPEDSSEEAPEEEEEEEEEEEAVDIKPKLEEECTHSPQCAPYKHHFDECVERVTRQEEDEDHKGPKEDCVEEFFHLTHCATQCAAPKLWRQLK